MPSFYSDALRFLEFGFNGATLLLAILAFRLLSAEQKRGDARPGNLQGLRLYRNFALLTSALMLISGPFNTGIAARYSPVRVAEFTQCRDAIALLEVDPELDPSQVLLVARQAHAECTSLMSTLALFFR